MGDPFLLLHHFGPAHISAMPQFGMHPHRGFNECPYLKQGRWLGTDPWNMAGEGQDALFAEGQLQWGKSGRGIEHGMKFDPSYDGPVQGFQLWINLRSENKLDPPEFQNARADAMPLVDVAPGAKAEATHPRPNGMSTLFVYVYEGSGTFCGASTKKGEVLRLSSSGDVHVKASSRLGFMLLAGEPLREPIVQHGPFVMSTQDQIMQAFQDYHSGNFLAEECTYKLHTKGKTVTSKRRIEGRR